MQATGVGPTKLAQQQWLQCMNWSDIEKWHKTWTPWISDIDAVKKHYMKVLDDLNEQTQIINPQLQEQINNKKRIDEEEQTVIKQMIAKFQQEEAKITKDNLQQLENQTQTIEEKQQILQETILQNNKNLMQEEQIQEQQNDDIKK